MKNRQNTFTHHHTSSLQQDRQVAPEASAAPGMETPPARCWLVGANFMFSPVSMVMFWFFLRLSSFTGPAVMPYQCVSVNNLS